MNPNNHPKVESKPTSKDTGIFAKEDVKADELISIFDGSVYFAESESKLPEIAEDTAVPFGYNYYRDGNPDSFSRLINHSCNPNCYVKNYFEIYSLKDIPKGSELQIMYSLICNSDWENPEGVCLCGEENCKGKIVPYRELTIQEKIDWLPYTSEWILFEEMKKERFTENITNIWKSRL